MICTKILQGLFTKTSFSIPGSTLCPVHYAGDPPSDPTFPMLRF